MTCYHPAKGFVIGWNAETQKREILYCSYDTDHVEVLGVKRMVDSDTGETWRATQAKRVYQADQKFPGSKVVRDYVLLPCGQCIGCRLKYSRDWAARMMAELECNEKACFITLTYDDEHVPRSSYTDSEGLPEVSMTLDKRDYQLFMKRLRKRFSGTRIRFYACGEYGSTTFRPHYHAILYGVDFSHDRYMWSKSKTGFMYYRSPTLERLWPYGHSLVCDVSFDTCAYVARYVTKKLNGPAGEFYRYFNIQPEFSTMSLKPGIGREYYNLHKHEIYENIEMHISDANGGKKVKPPRYYDKLYDCEYPALSSEVKRIRAKIADNISSQKLQKYSGSFLEMLQAEEDNVKAQRFLKRRL